MAPTSATDLWRTVYWSQLSQFSAHNSLNKYLKSYFYILVLRFFMWSECAARGRSQKQAFRENRDSDRLNNGFELKIWSANLTLSGPKLPNLQMIIFIFDRFRAFFLGPFLFCTPGIMVSIELKEKNYRIYRVKHILFFDFIENITVYPENLDSLDLRVRVTNIDFMNKTFFV